MDFLTRGPLALFRRRRRRTEPQPGRRPGRPNGASESTAVANSASPLSVDTAIITASAMMTHGGATAQPARITRPPKRLEQLCVCCCEGASSERYLISVCGSCSNLWCPSCIQHVFERAINYGTEMPPRCCVVIPLHFALAYLSDSQIAAYKRRFEEWLTSGKDRVYCPTVECGEPVALRAQGVFKRQPEMHENDRQKQRADSPMQTSSTFTADTITCGACGTLICLICKATAHGENSCGPAALQSNADQDLVAQLGKWGYKQCPRCRHGVRRMFGCSHIQCVCGEHWCWWCAQPLSSCENNDACEGSDYNEQDSDPESDQSEPEYNSYSADKDSINTEDTEKIVERMEDGIEPEFDRCPYAGQSSRRAVALPSRSAPNLRCEEPVSVLEPPSRRTQGQSERPASAGQGTAFIRGLLEREASARAASAHRPLSPSPVVQEAASPPQRERRRPSPNLDAGSGAYWEERGLNFGAEPDVESHRNLVWDGLHIWKKMESPWYVEKDPRKTRKHVGSEDEGETAPNSAALASAQAKVECHYCWREVQVASDATTEADDGNEEGLHPEQASQCSGCGIIVCRPCVGRMAYDFGYVETGP